MNGYLRRKQRREKLAAERSEAQSQIREHQRAMKLRQEVELLEAAGIYPGASLLRRRPETLQRLAYLQLAQQHEQELGYAD